MKFSEEQKQQIKEAVKTMVEAEPTTKEQEKNKQGIQQLTSYFLENWQKEEQWLWGTLESINEEAVIGYFVYMIPQGFVSGLIIEQNGQQQIKAWPDLLVNKSPEQIVRKMQASMYKSRLMAESHLFNAFYNQVVRLTSGKQMLEPLTVKQQALLHEDTLYSRDLTELEDSQLDDLSHLLNTKPVSLNFFAALDPLKKFESENYWEVLATKKRWMETKKLNAQRLHFVQLNRNQPAYGVYVR